MKRKSKFILTIVALFVTLGLVTAACNHNDDSASGNCDKVDKVKLQLQWFTQAQFAGYYAAVEQGYYSDLCLDVEILQGAVEIVPITVLTTGGADFAISWVPKVFGPIEGGSDVVNIAQVFERSGTLQVSFKDSNINSVSDLDGKRVGNWGFGNEFELLAGLKKNNLDPDSDVQLTQQAFDMSALLNRDIDAAQAMIYNEYAQVLEAINPDTSQLYTADDLNIIDWNDEGTAMLQDAIWADKSKLESDSNYRDIATRFVEGSLEGWIWCRDNPTPCVEVVLKNAPTLGRSHQTWQLNEINGLIWPSSNDVSVMNINLANQTARVATEEDIVESNPGSDWYRTDIAEAATKNLKDKGHDVRGLSWQKATVTLLEGGK